MKLFEFPTISSRQHLQDEFESAALHTQILFIQFTKSPYV